MDVSAFFSPRNSDSQACAVHSAASGRQRIGMGGTVAALAARGCEVHYLTVTNGDLGQPAEPMDPAALADLRREETVAAGRALGARFHFFGEPDGSLESVPALAGKIAELIRSVQPDVVFCPDPWAPTRPISTM